MFVQAVSEPTERGEGPGCEEERVPRQEGRDHQTGLAEDDGPQEDVDCRAVLRDEGREVPVIVKIW
jgi:hypothetical protein